jgi:2-hydroxy-3-keto-5-methylthiopentenyl-1-phosphate phosphatase
MNTEVMVPNEQVVFTDFDGNEGILVDLNTKKYYQLNETAMLVWKSLEKRLTFGEIVAAMISAYDVSPEQATESVERLLTNLRQYRLVT